MERQRSIRLPHRFRPLPPKPRLTSGTWSEIDVIVDSDVIDAAPELEFDTDGRLHIVFVRSDYTSDPLSVDIYHTVNSGIAWARHSR